MTTWQPAVVREKCVFPQQVESGCWRLMAGAEKMISKAPVTQAYRLVSDTPRPPLPTICHGKMRISKQVGKNCLVIALGGGI